MLFGRYLKSLSWMNLPIETCRFLVESRLQSSPGVAFVFWPSKGARKKGWASGVRETCQVGEAIDSGGRPVGVQMSVF